jgi:HEAT repeat protein
VEERKEAIDQIRINFAELRDKEQVWADLLRLTQDKDREVRQLAAKSLGSVSPHVQDKEQALADLYVHVLATRSLVSFFTHVSDKEQALADPIRLIQAKHSDFRQFGATLLGSVFLQVPNKEQAWADLIRLTQAKHSDVRQFGAKSLGFALSHGLVNKQVLVDLIRLTQDEDSDVRYEAAKSLCLAFHHVPDKEQAWADLLRLTQDKDSDVLHDATCSLSFVFLHVQDKEQAWADNLRLTQDENSGVRYDATLSLGSVFRQVPDKEQAWADLHLLAQDEDSDVRHGAARSLVSVFPHVPEKEQAWADLHLLAQDEDSDVRHGAARSLVSVFPQVPDKEQAWADLLRLTQDKDREVRQIAAKSLGSVSPHVPDKEQAWTDLILLTQDKNRFVRRLAAKSLDSVFPHVPDKKQAWADLILLTQDEDWNVRVFANYSLGRASIFRATKAEREEVFRQDLENALAFFENASTEAIFINPSNFCLPFYRSFYTITFKEQESEAEVQRYLDEAKSATEGSENKEQLLEAIENLADALKEVQAIRETDFDIMKRDLNAYRRYCDRAADLLDFTEEKAPGATKLIRRGLPIIDAKIKEIQYKANIACQQSKGISTEEIACATNQEVQKWKISNQVQMTQKVENLIFSLKSKIPFLPENKPIHDKIEEIRKEKDLIKQYEILAILIALIPTAHITSEKIEKLEEKLDGLIISLKPGIHKELVITVGLEALGTGVKEVITIPQEAIDYPKLEDDLKKIKGKSRIKLASLPSKLAKKVKGYLIRNKKDDILKHLS